MSVREAERRVRGNNRDTESEVVGEKKKERGGRSEPEMESAEAWGF